MKNFLDKSDKIKKIKSRGWIKSKHKKEKIKWIRSNKTIIFSIEESKYRVKYLIEDREEEKKFKNMDKAIKFINKQLTRLENL